MSMLATMKALLLGLPASSSAKDSYDTARSAVSRRGRRVSRQP